MQLFALRHTSVGIPENICYGYSDIPLSESFETEAEVVLKELESIKFNKVYSSPLSRCTSLADKISKDYIISENLKEMNFGKWEMQIWDDINDDYFKKWAENYTVLPCPDGESFQNLLDRANHFLENIVNNKSRNTLVVTHSGVIRAFHVLINRISTNKIFDVKIPFGSLSKFNL